jgi:phage/plasmid-like protein (TIGR03299 family)
VQRIRHPLAEGLAKYETAGALRDGRRVWMLLKLPDELKVGKEDLIQPFMLLYNTFDGSSCLRALLTATRVVCQNTLNLALGRAGNDGVTIRHRGDLQSRVDQARTTLGLAQRRMKAFGQEVVAMRKVEMGRESLNKYFNTIVSPLSSGASQRERNNRERSLDHLMENFSNDTNSLPGMRGTLWGAFNAATEFADHQRRFRGNNDLARRENRLDSIWFGTSADLKATAYRSALELAQLN